MRGASQRALRALLLAFALSACAEAGGPSEEPNSDAAPEPAAETSATEGPEGALVETDWARALSDYVPGPIAMRRLTRAHYVATIRALFGADLQVLAPTEVDLRVEGLYTVGAGSTSITPAGAERYELSARQVASDVLSPERRDALMSCAPVDINAPDDTCAAAFVDDVAPRVLRRGLRSGEAEVYVALARSAAEDLGGFYRGLEAILAAWLLSPDFLFIQERALPPTDEAASMRLTGETLASRLSYFFWNQGPDAELLEAALSGALDTDEGYVAQVDRLMADTARLEAGVRALFTDLYELDELAHVTKDQGAFPQFTSAVLEDAKEQTLRTIVDHLLVQRADYRDLFTTPKTFMTWNLGPIYRVPVAEPWEVHEFPEADARAGILTHVSFLALHARSSRSSPVLRGEFILDAVLCMKIPPPPPDVNFDTLTPGDPDAPTARARLEAHRIEPSCAGCHDLIDPIGLALENFDAIGQFRTHEGEAEIETYGRVEGIDYDDVVGFHQALRSAPRVTECMVQKLYMHAVGRVSVAEEAAVLDALDTDFASTGYDFMSLMRKVALTHGFRSTSGPKEASQ